MALWGRHRVASAKFRMGCCACFLELPLVVAMVFFTSIGLFAFSPASIGEYALLFHIPHTVTFLMTLILSGSKSRELFCFGLGWQTFVFTFDLFAQGTIVYALYACYGGVSPPSCANFLFANILAGLLSLVLLFVTLFTWIDIFTVVRFVWRAKVPRNTEEKVKGE